MNDDTSGTSGGHDNDFNNDGIPDYGFSSDPYDDGPVHHHSGFGHDFHHGRRRRRGHPDLSTAPTWVKVFTWVGALTAVLGVAIVFFGIVGRAGDGFDAVDGDRLPGVVREDPFAGGDRFPGGGSVVTFEDQVLDLDDFQEHEVRSRAVGPVEGSSPIGLGFGVFFVGFVLAVVAALGHSTSKRR